MSTKDCSVSELNSNIKTCVDKIVKQEEYIEHVIKTRAITDGDNYLAELFEVDIKGKSKDGDKQTHLFIKRIISDEGMTMLSTSDIHSREKHIYGEFFDIAKELMTEAKVPDTEKIWLVKCYDANTELIVFENLARQGFTTLHSTDAIQYQFVELAIKQLAKFHGLSFVMQKKRPKYFERHIKSLKYPVTMDTEEYAKFIQESVDACLSQLDNHRKEIVNKAFDQFKCIYKFFEQPWRCLCHGDYRSLNILIKKEEGSIVDMTPIDFQMIYYGNPMNDFYYLMIPHTDQEFRKQHMQTMKELYYTSLTQFLKYFDIDVADVYSRNDFDSDYKEQALYGLGVSLLLIPFVFAKSDAKPDVTKDSLVVAFEESVKKRLEGIVDDYVDWGLI